jgi:hypothetical protein
MSDRILTVEPGQRVLVVTSNGILRMLPLCSMVDHAGGQGASWKVATGRLCALRRDYLDDSLLRIMQWNCEPLVWSGFESLLKSNTGGVHV